MSLHDLFTPNKWRDEMRKLPRVEPAAKPTQTFELDTNVDHCEGCGTITGNQWGLCSCCTAEEENDTDYGRRSGRSDW